jgi:hypothetical protein
MKPKIDLRAFAKWIILAVAIIMLSTWKIGAQTNVLPVLTTNYVMAVPYYREVNGQLYNTERSSLWKPFYGDILQIATNELIISTFTQEPIYQAVTVEGDDGIHIHPQLMSKNVVVGHKKVTGRKIILVHYSEDQGLATGQTIEFRAMRVGTKNYNGEVIEIWDYGMLHVAAVVTTNYPPQAKRKN